jgi:hypothetical protein
MELSPIDMADDVADPILIVFVDVFDILGIVAILIDPANSSKLHTLKLPVRVFI